MAITDATASSPEQLFSDLAALGAANDIHAALHTNATREFNRAQDAVREGTDDGSLSLHANELLVASRAAETQAIDLRRDIASKFAGRLITVKTVAPDSPAIVRHTVVNNIYDVPRPQAMGYTSPWQKVDRIKKGVLFDILEDGSLRIEKPITKWAKFLFVASLGTNVRDNYRVYPFNKNGDPQISLEFID